MASGQTLWEDLVAHYDRGVTYVGDMRRQWDGVRAQVDAERWQKTATYLAVQEREAARFGKLVGLCLGSLSFVRGVV